MHPSLPCTASEYHYSRPLLNMLLADGSHGLAGMRWPLARSQSRQGEGRQSCSSKYEEAAEEEG